MEARLLWLGVVRDASWRAGPHRLAKLREAIGDMDEALRDEGFESLGSHAVYVRWQRSCVEALGAIVVEAERELGGAGRERLCDV